MRSVQGEKACNGVRCVEILTDHCGGVACVAQEKDCKRDCIVQAQTWQRLKVLVYVWLQAACAFQNPVFPNIRARSIRFGVLARI
eukprot:4051306-Amphidinium_carterae.1